MRRRAYRRDCGSAAPLGVQGMAKLSPLSLVVGSGALMAIGFLILSREPKLQATIAGPLSIPERPDWNWDVRPILSQNCFACHGQGTQKAGLRLDDEKVATGELPENKGHRAIVPGNPGRSDAGQADHLRGRRLPDAAEGVAQDSHRARHRHPGSG